MSARVVLVDAEDREVGTAGKLEAHLGDGRLHRAFSVFVLSGAGEVLIQRRADAKMLWPGHWSNACCSHPAPGEPVEAAARRRLGEELGMEAPCERLYAFEYRARFGAIGVEHELCHVLVARSDAAPIPNPAEVAEIAWLSPEALDARIARDPGAHTPWFRMEWLRLRARHAAVLEPCDA